mmetsp:Transcript_16001/g.50166  ORF Transcript_16001/g.50166 Transcript_16001/m.50166 type:complete len:264 (+) Transcript_16001:35-826(+)
MASAADLHQALPGKRPAVSEEAPGLLGRGAEGGPEDGGGALLHGARRGGSAHRRPTPARTDSVDPEIGPFFGGDSGRGVEHGFGDFVGSDEGATHLVVRAKGNGFEIGQGLRIFDVAPVRGGELVEGAVSGADVDDSSPGDEGRREQDSERGDEVDPATRLERLLVPLVEIDPCVVHQEGHGLLGHATPTHPEIHRHRRHASGFAVRAAPNQRVRRRFRIASTHRQHSIPFARQRLSDRAPEPAIRPGHHRQWQLRPSCKDHS